MLTPFREAAEGKVLPRLIIPGSRVGQITKLYMEGVMGSSVGDTEGHEVES